MTTPYTSLADADARAAGVETRKALDRAKQAPAKRSDPAEVATHYELAQRWLQHRSLADHAPVYSGGMWYAPRPDGLWQALEIAQVETEIAALFPAEKLCRKGGDYRQIASVAASIASEPRFFEGAPLGVVTPAGFHTMRTDGTVVAEPLSLEHRQTFRLSWAPDAECQTPLFDGMLLSALRGDDETEQAAMLVEVIGAVLFGLLPRLQKVCLLIGREGSGKSTIQRLIERLFPADAVSAVSPASWGREYNVAALAGKRLNVVGELSDEAPIPAAAFKNVTGQNLIEGRHPTHRPFYFTCTASHLFAANVLPPTTDRTDAFYRRWCIVVFRNRVTDAKVDPDLLDKMLAREVPGILARAFAGAESVAVAGRMRSTDAQARQIAKWKAAANPVLQYLLDEDAVELDKVAPTTPTKDVYDHYRRWSSAAGFRNPFGRNHFLELLDATGGQVGVAVRRQMVSGMRVVRSTD